MGGRNGGQQHLIGDNQLQNKEPMIAQIDGESGRMHLT